MTLTISFLLEIYDYWQNIFTIEMQICVSNSGAKMEKNFW
jgi:hypothetical protein